jgi:hypothetical protein
MFPAMKWVVAIAAAVVATGAGASPAEAKERGCEYRLAGVRDARIELAIATKKHVGAAHAQAKLDRALGKAADERCFVPARFDRRGDAHRAAYYGAAERRRIAEARRAAARRAEIARSHARLRWLHAEERRRCLTPVEERERARLKIVVALGR